MAISTEGKIGIALALVLAVAGAVSVLAPDSAKPIAWLVVAVCMLGLIGLGAAHWADLWRRRTQPGEGTKMLSFVGMVVCIGGALAFGAWHFWPQRQEAGAPVVPAPISSGGEGAQGYGMRGGSGGSGHSGGGGGAIGSVLIGPRGEVMFPGAAGGGGGAAPGGTGGAGGSANVVIPPGWRVATPDEAAKAQANVEAIRKAIYDNALAPTNDAP